VRHSGAHGTREPPGPVLRIEYGTGVAEGLVHIVYEPGDPLPVFHRRRDGSCQAKVGETTSLKDAHQQFVRTRRRCPSCGKRMNRVRVSTGEVRPRLAED
jgi:hypothetical protein